MRTEYKILIPILIIIDFAVGSQIKSQIGQCLTVLCINAGLFTLVGVIVEAFYDRSKNK